MVVRMTKQISWRWLPGPPESLTNTLVQNVGDWYVDLRLLKSDNSLDYAFAGEETVLEAGPENYQIIQWTKKICNRGGLQTYVFDVIKPPTGDFLEMGEVEHFETGILTSFRERWRPLEIPPASQFPYAWILQSTDGKTFLGLTGGLFQAIRGFEGPGSMNGFCSRREFWSEEKSSWVTNLEGGSATNVKDLPRISLESKHNSAWDWQATCCAGDTVQAFDGAYIVRAIEKIP